MKKALPPLHINYIRATLTSSSTTSLVGQENSAPVSVKRSVRQGNPLSPMLFNIVLDDLINELTSTDLGCPLNPETRCPVLTFADDVVLLAESEKNLQELVDKCLVFFESRGMAVNPAKCYALIKKKRERGSGAHY